MPKSVKTHIKWSVRVQPKIPSMQTRAVWLFSALSRRLPVVSKTRQNKKELVRDRLFCWISITLKAICLCVNTHFIIGNCLLAERNRSGVWQCACVVYWLALIMSQFYSARLVAWLVVILLRLLRSCQFSMQMNCLLWWQWTYTSCCDNFVCLKKWQSKIFWLISDVAQQLFHSNKHSLFSENKTIDLYWFCVEIKFLLLLMFKF